VQEPYGCDASWWVAHAPVEEIGAESTAIVVRAATENRTACPSETTDTRNGWTAVSRTVLDLLEGVGGSAEADDLFRT